MEHPVPLMAGNCFHDDFKTYMFIFSALNYENITFSFYIEQCFFFIILHIPLFPTPGMGSRDEAINLTWLVAQQICETLH
jgi:hypothetical protein